MPDLTGKKFNHLTVLQKLPKKDKCVWWLCECVCGKQIELRQHHFANEFFPTKSCGCMKPKKKTGDRICQRCNTKRKSEEFYGHRQVCNICIKPDHNEKAKTRNRSTKLKAFTYYSNGTPACNCCGEQIIEFLCIDHINGGGNIDRRANRRSGKAIYRWLIKNNYPDGYQVLCQNCNIAKGLFGKCPHEAIKASLAGDTKRSRKETTQIKEPHENRTITPVPTANHQQDS